jgi:peptide/nickel transport system permease protein
MRSSNRTRLRIGLGMLGLIAGIALFAPWIASSRPLAVRTDDGWTLLPRGAELGRSRVNAPIPYGPNETNLAERLEPPSPRHWFGTDELGRDVASRMVHGARISLLVGFAAAAFSLILGALIGAAAGYYGGAVDLLVSRLIDVLIAFPFLVLLLAVLSLFGAGLWTIIFVLALSSWTAEARMVRGEMLRIRELEWASAARASGASDAVILFRHLLPNAVAPALVTAAFGVSSAILFESALSFLGFGVQLPQASWGSILSTADDYLRQAWWLALFPGLAIFATVLAANLVGESLRVSLAPKSDAIIRG